MPQSTTGVTDGPAAPPRPRRPGALTTAADLPYLARMPPAFLQHPGRSGPFGALMDEYARAAVDFCAVAGTFDRARFESVHPANDENTKSPRGVCTHVVRAAYRYAHYIRKARGVDFVDAFDLDPARLTTPADVPGLLVEAIRFTEDTVEPLLGLDETGIQALSFNVRWGPRYDPEMILEHGVCHLLRHRRQLERW